MPIRHFLLGIAATNGIVRAMNETAASHPPGAGDHVYLVDGSGYIFRAYHALPPLTRKRDRLPVGAVAGFCNMLNKLLQDTRQGDRPTHFAVIFDYSGKSFRNDIYPDYKAHRPPAPEDLVPQFPLIRDAVKAFNVPCIEMEGYEADDLIATFARQAADAGARVTIVSSDKDLMQLVGERVEMLDTMKNRLIREPEVIEKFGVAPDRVVDVQALAGDSSDNVPGVPGIGVKTGAQLINEYGDLDAVLARTGEIRQTKRRENLIKFADLARISRDLVRLDRAVPVAETVADFAVRDPDPATLIGFLKAMEFNTLTRRVGDALNVDPDAFEPCADTPGMAGVAAADPPANPDPPDPDGEGRVAGGPTMVAERAKRTVLKVPFDEQHYETIREVAALERWIENGRDAGAVAFDTETNSLDAMRADLVGFSLSIEPGAACYVPLGHRADDGLGLDGDVGVQVPADAALAALKPLLEDAGVLKIGQNIKYDWLVMARHGIEITPIDDTMLLSYALDSGLGGHGMDELSRRHLDHSPIPFKEVAGRGRAAVTFDLVAIEKAAPYAAEDADVTLRLHRVLKPRLVAEHRTTVYETLERPMVPVLGAMERAGITVDRAVLASLSGDFAKTLGRLETEIHKLAGETFNIGSPKQLGEILFDRMGLEGARKTKTGAWGTGADVLEQLAAEGHELPAKVLEWRQLSKLRSTYTDALPGFINPETGRVHTSYSLASTTTGRLSSSEPNLQNIPVRTPEGRKIRTAFVATKGHQLLSADYSQIELRVLAHIAGIDRLKQAFADGLDIHAMTASEMFGVPVEGMDPSVRRRAKAINFGIIYGISAFGLANQLAIPRAEAKAYIDTYFERFPGIRSYMDKTVEFCRRTGYVETAFGRRCHYPEINSKNPAQRGFMERAAINAPIQGTAADILRRAMIRMPGALKDAGLGATMLLQVHDELIFEVADAEISATTDVVRVVMERACEPALALTVPLKVDAKAAANWEEAH